MSQVQFDATVGGDGSIVTDDSNAATGLGNGGFWTRLVPMFTQIIAVANWVKTNGAAYVAAAGAHVTSASGFATNASNSASAAATSATSAVNAPGTNATSVTSTALVATGSVTLTVQASKAFVVGQPVMIARTSAPTLTWMAGLISAYDSGTGSLTLSVNSSLGSGTFTDWTISLTGQPMPSVRENKAAPAIAANVLAINCAAANAFVTALNANITSFTITNIPVSGSFYGFVLELIADGTARTVTWSFQGVTVKWPGGLAPTLTSTLNKKDTFVFYTYDAGASWVATVCGQNF